MNAETLKAALQELPVSAVRYFDRVGSTNDLAAEWAAQGAPDFAVVVAGEQTAGRGRAGRRWYTLPGGSLAFSLILEPGGDRGPPAGLPRLTALGAVALCESLSELYGLSPQIKWPNDLLLGDRKAAGVLAEAGWEGDRLRGLVLGIGVNLTPSSVPPAERLDFPATCVQEAAGVVPDPLDVLRATLAAIDRWRRRYRTGSFLLAWESRLAYLGSTVRALSVTGQEIFGVLEGLTPDGHLRLRLPSGEAHLLASGDVRLRPG